MLGLTLAGAALAREEKFDVSGTVIAIDDSIPTIVSSDIIGKPQPIMVDVSELKKFSVAVGSPISLTIRAREFDTFLAVGVVRESPFVTGQDFGVREEFTVKQDSIAAGAGNVPADEEALAQQHRDHNLRKRKRNDDPVGF